MKRKLYISYFVLAALAVNLSGCIKDYQDPGSAIEETVITNPKALAGVVTGLQSRYSSGRNNVYRIVSPKSLSLACQWLFNR